MDTQVVGAAAIMLLAFTGVTLDMQIPEWIPVVGSAAVGSLQAMSARVRRGHVKGIRSMIWTAIAGFSCGLIVGQSVGSLMGMHETISVVLPVYIFALMGGRLVLWISTGVSVEDIGNAILDRFIKKKD